MYRVEFYHIDKLATIDFNYEWTAIMYARDIRSMLNVDIRVVKVIEEVILILPITDNKSEHS